MEKEHAHHGYHSEKHEKKEIRACWKGAEKFLKPAYIIPAVIVLAVLVALIYKFTFAVPSKFGDNLKIEYSIEDEQGNILTAGTESFALGNVYQQFGMSTNQLDKEISKISLNKERTITLSAKDAFGEYDKENIQVINRTKEFNKTMALEYSIDAYKQQFGKDPKVGESIQFNQYWNSTIVAFTNTTITLRHELTEGQILPLPINGTVDIHITADTVSLYYNPGEQLYISGGTVNVVDITANDFTVDYNSEYAGKNIIFKIKVLEIQKAKKANLPSAGEIPGAPVLEVFVMTHCPYGTQIEKGLIPVYELLGDNANIKVRFVSYTMHGDKEEQETKRQLCLREGQKDKFWPYLECFLGEGNSADCLEQTDADTNALAGCMAAKADEYWEVDKVFNEQYGVRGSPTAVLDGQIVNLDRDSESLKKAICEAFDAAPEDCSVVLSSAAPSAGFGYSSSSGPASGGCASA